MDYTVLLDCHALVVELTGLEASDTDLLLERTAGTKTEDDATTIYYRPYYVSALVLERRVMVLESGEGATFRSPSSGISSLYESQAKIDQELLLSIPVAYRCNIGLGVSF